MDKQSKKGENEKKSNDFFRLGEPVVIKHLNNLPGVVVGVLGNGAIDVFTSSGVVRVFCESLGKVA